MNAPPRQKKKRNETKRKEKIQKKKRRLSVCMAATSFATQLSIRD
jgi:hypothetical protein